MFMWAMSDRGIPRSLRMIQVRLHRMHALRETDGSLARALE
jgi:catalase